MGKFLLTLLFGISLIGPVSAKSDDWADVAHLALKSIVYIESDEGACTGWVGDSVRKYVITAAHCDSSAGKIWVDKVVGTVISKDTKKDLMVFEVKNLDPSRPALKLAAEDVKIGEEVVSLGYGMALETPLARRAMISDTALMIPEGGIGGPFVAVDSAFVGGQSGGPVINHKGEVVMIVQRASDTTGIGVSASIIRERVGRFLGK